MHAERERSWLRRWWWLWPRRRPAGPAGDEPAKVLVPWPAGGPGPSPHHPHGSSSLAGCGRPRPAPGRRALRLPFSPAGPGQETRAGGRGARTGSPEDDAAFDWVRAVEEARRDWEQARLYFECVTDQDLVDQAIHLVLAAEKRYAYLLKQARQRGIQGLPAHPGDPAGRKVAP